MLRSLLLLAALVAAGTALAQSEPPTEIAVPAPRLERFSNVELNLEFAHPADWKRSNPRRGTVNFAFPVQGTGATANLEIVFATFVAETDAWQSSQRAFVQNAKRTLLRQWDEEILGVPLLLTQSRWGEGDAERTALVGLLYNKANRKLMFRLESPTAAYDQALVQWREVMASLRTLDGNPLEREDPSRLNALPTGKDGRRNLEGDRSATLSRAIPTAEAGEAVLAPVTVAARAAGRDLDLRLPEGWTAREGEDAWMLSHPEVSGAVRAQVLSTIDSEPAARAWLRQAGTTLQGFTRVASRQETLLSRPNRAGALGGFVWRTGDTSAGAKTTFDGFVSKGDFYVLLQYLPSAAPSPRERQLLEALVQAASVERRP